MSRPLDPQSLNRIFLAARTVNAFLPQEVTDATLAQIYDIAKWGPTSMNCQPARYLFLRSGESRERLIRTLAPGNVDKTRSAPVTVIAAIDQEFYESLPELFPVYDARPMYQTNPDLAASTAFRNASLQAAYFMIAARALGLDCGPMSGFDAAKVDEEFFPCGIYKTNFLINLGYGDPASSYPRGPRLDFDRVAAIL